MTQDATLEMGLSFELVSACHILYNRGLVANHDGNITVKLRDGSLLATPTSFSKGDVAENDLLRLDSKGKVIKGNHKVFSEISWHLAVYRARPDVNCIVHAHPVTASGYALAGRDLGVPALPEAIVSLGRMVLSTGFVSPLDSVFEAGGIFEQEVKRVTTDSDAFLSFLATEHGV